MNSIKEFMSESSAGMSITLQLKKDSAAELRSRIQLLEAMAIKMSEQDRGQDGADLIIFSPVSVLIRAN